MEDRSVERDERGDPRVARREHHVGQAAEAVADDGDVARVGVGIVAQRGEGERHVARLRLGPDHVRGHRPTLGPDRRHGGDDVAVAGQVLAEDRVLEGRAAQAGGVEDEREGPLGARRRGDGRGRRGEEGAHRVGRNPLRRGEGDERLELRGARGVVERPEVDLARGQGDVVGERNVGRLRGRRRRVPDEDLDRPRDLALVRRAVGVARRIERARLVPRQNRLETDGVRPRAQPAPAGVGRTGGEGDRASGEKRGENGQNGHRLTHGDSPSRGISILRRPAAGCRSRARLFPIDGRARRPNGGGSVATARFLRRPH